MSRMYILIDYNFFNTFRYYKLNRFIIFDQITGIFTLNTLSIFICYVVFNNVQFQIFISNKEFIQFMISFLFISILLINIQSKNMAQKPVTIVEANHFYSTNQYFTNYQVNQITVGKPLAFILKPKPQQPSYNNSITIQLKSRNDVAICNYKSFTDLCVLEKTNENIVNMKIQCQKLPCQAYFASYQAPVIQSLEVQQLNELYRLDNKFKHLIVMFISDSPDVKDFDNSIKIYSNQEFKRGYIENIIFALFKNIQNGYLYVQASKQIKAVTKMHVYKVNNQIKNQSKVKDFIQKQGNVYKIDKTPGVDIRLDATIHQFDKKSTLISKLNATLSGKIKGNRQVIQQFFISPPQNSTYFNFNLLFSKKIIQNYQDLQLQLKSTNQMIMITLQAQFVNVHQIDPQEISYFSLQKDQKIMYKLQAMPENDDDTVQVSLKNDNNLVKSSQKTCKMKIGCQIQLTATNKIQASLELSLENIRNNHIQIKQSYRSKIREGETLYFVYKNVDKKQIKIVENSENIILYVGDSKCQRPSNTCFNFSGNHRQPIYIENFKSQQIYIAVIGLDNTAFTLRIIENSDEYIHLVDGQPFTYAIKKENKIGFSFTLKQNSDVQFNLISPLHSLLMYINNDNSTQPNKESGVMSSEGHIAYKKKQLTNKNFIIIIEKVNETIQFVHFTLIATTTKSIVTLEPTISHYDTLGYKKPKIYIVEYNKNQTNIISLFCFGHNAVEVQLNVSFSKVAKLFDSEYSILIKKPQEVIQLQKYGNQLCNDQIQDYCQLYVKIQNMLETQIDLTLNFMSQNSILELKDGLWQSFPLTVTTSSTSFFFIPKHPNKTINILYNSTFRSLILAYRLWKIDQSVKLNPNDWPFPVENNETNESKNLTNLYNPIKQISISGEQLKQCWPDCVVLMALHGIQRHPDKPYIWENSRTYDRFSIAVTNDIIQMSQHQKLEIILHKDETKQLLIDLKTVIDKEVITFFSYILIGQVNMYGSVSSNSNNRSPSATQYDFNFGLIETQIKMESIKKKLKEYKMQNDTEKYFKIIIVPFLQTKLSFQFSTFNNIIKQLHYQSFQSVKMKAGEEKMYQLIAILPYRIKFVRILGYPFYGSKQCANQDLDNCIEQFDNMKQFTGKTIEQVGNSSDKNIVVLKIQAKQNIEFDIYVLSPYGELQLKQGTMLTDFGLKDQRNKYMLTTLKTKQTIITVHVLQGDPRVNVTDLSQLNILNRKKNKDNLIHISIPPHTQKTVTNNLPHFYNPFSLNAIFEILHISIQDQSINDLYTISYTSGDRGIQLIDGLISKIVLEPQKNITLFYINTFSKPLYLTLTFETVIQLKSTNIKVIYSNDETQDQQMVPSIPELQKKTPHPTITFKLIENYKYYQIQLINNSTSKNVTITILINEVSQIYLPYFTQYPIILNENETQYLISDIRQDGILVIIIRKCNQGVPQLSYTFNQTNRENDDYQFVTQIKELRQEIVVKVKIGTIYLKISADSHTIMSIQTKYYQSKKDIPKDHVKLVNQGMVSYKLSNSNDAQITFSTLTCNKQCPKVTYQYITSQNLSVLYNQLVCPSNYFTFNQQNPLLPTHNIQSTTKSNEEIKFFMNLIDQVVYVGIRAKLSDGRQFIYNPIEITTFWGEIRKNPHYSNIFLILLVSLVLCCVFVFYRRRKRRQYKILNESQS